MKINKIKKRKILFVTERRADYSRLKPIMKLVKESNKLTLQLVITGLHLSKEFGDTSQVIEKDGFHVDAFLPVYKKGDADDGVAMSHSFGSFVHVLTDAISKLKPDVVFCGFDLGAHLAAAIVGMHLNIPVAHIQGGERSGTIDEVIRHATTKFSHIHFVATKESKKRVIKLGEDPKYVFLVGSPSLDTIHSIKYQSRNKVFKKYGINPKKLLIIFSQHPVTTEVDEVVKQIKESVEALSYFKKEYNAEVIAIYSNNDSGGKRIVKELQKSDFKVFPHIVYEDYLRLLKVADVLVGNSSAGIHEAPSFGLPVVNIGTRQQFRERGVNVIDVSCNKNEIKNAITKALLDKKFIVKVKKGKNPYDFGKAAPKIINVLEKVVLPSVQKVIYY
ncbi:MAG: UDP-N-acetylglucosamine 2-epimerase [Candidatus Nomurabacteria bacterium]|nr:UDP-N-acetylglucosamine 2-epimerase [Candidatus Nomurabacteria bacterium]